MTQPDFTLELELPVTPAQVYAAWLDPQQHAAMTGAAATLHVDGRRFTAWDGYIEGEYLNLTPNQRISMHWRTSDFASDACDARVVIELSPTPAGVRLRLSQFDTPADQGDRYVDGWETYYFAPMRAYFPTHPR